MGCLLGHKWNGCKCEKCGKIRDEQHMWKGCECSLCGKVRDEQHIWGRRNDYTNNCKCTRCGKSITRQDINKITDQPILGIIAEFADANSSNVCYDALEKLTDQKILADLAIKGSTYMLRMSAAEKLSNQILAQEVFVDVVKNCDAMGLVYNAIKKLTDSSIIADIEKNGKYNSMREWAHDRLLDLKGQQELYAIIKNSKDNDLREKAIMRLTDQNILFEIASSNDSEKYRYEEEVPGWTGRGDDAYIYGWKKLTYDIRDTARERLAELKNK